MLKKILYTVLTDFLPIILFVLVYDRRGFAKGTIVLIISTVLVAFISYFKDKRIPLLPIFVALTTAIFGMLTLDTMNPKYIQMRDTFYDGTFAIILLISLYFKNKLILKDMFGHVFTKLNDREWVIITWNWIIHFAVLSLSNEIIRRHYRHYWLDYKSFVIFLTIAHGIGLIYYFRKKL